MKVQIDVDDEVWCKAKADAGLYRRTLGQIVQEALVHLQAEWELDPPKRLPARTTKEVTTSFLKAPDGGQKDRA